jgi:hypothetical protein
MTEKTCPLSIFFMVFQQQSIHNADVKGERKYSPYSFLTSTTDGGEWSASHPTALYPRGNGPAVPIGQEAGWAPEPVWTQRLEEKSFVSGGD